jgi:hypothetical protein
MTRSTHWAIFPLLVAISGCGSDSEEAPSENCPTPSDPVSFETDVLPIFRLSCGLSSSCHGSLTSSQADLYLGPKNSAADPTAAERTAIITGLVGVASKTAPSMPLVTAGDASQSFLVHKLDDTHNTLGLTCTAQPGAKSNEPCGDLMPQGTQMAACRRDIVRDWVQQGAQDN